MFSYTKRASRTALAVATAGLMAAPAMAQDATLKIGGRVMLDYNVLDGDASNADFSATEVRRARLKASGTYGSNIKYKFEVNTDSSEDVNIEDAYVQWYPTGDKWYVLVGQDNTQNSLDEQTSSLFMSTLERAAFTDAFQFNRRIGVSVGTSGKNFTASAGIFGENTSDVGDQEGMAMAARGTYTPINENGTLVHVGASVRYRDQGDTSGNIRYRQRAFAHIPGRIISTGSIAESDTFVGIEAAGIFNQFWAAGEYGMTNANCSTCASDPDFDGAYVEAGAFFGGKKTYKGGKFNRPKVDRPVTDGGYGAVSVVARYDTIDLADTAIDGGKLDTIILGADWWPTKQTRIGINYFDGNADLGTSTSGLDSDFAALVTAGVTQEDVSGLVARAQFDF